MRLPDQMSKVTDTKERYYILSVCSEVIWFNGMSTIDGYLMRNRVCVCVWEREREREFGFFLCLMAYQLFLGYLMPKPFSETNSSGTI